MGYSEQVRRVKEILQLRWCQDAFFTTIRGQMCCCVHGAAQIVCNPSVGEIFAQLHADNNATSAARMGHVAALSDCIKASWEGEANADAHQGCALNKAWLSRPDWVKTGGDDAVKNGNTSLHYLLGMFGITGDFNDNEGTNLALMNHSLDLCAQWAEQNEEFLQSN